MMPFHSINRLVWEDGEEFRPQRWMDPNSRPGAEQLPRGWSGILTFGDGPRNCLGLRLGQ
jgi:cytochrome P450